MIMTPKTEISSIFDFNSLFDLKEYLTEAHRDDCNVICFVRSVD